MIESELKGIMEMNKVWGEPETAFKSLRLQLMSYFAWFGERISGAYGLGGSKDLLFYLNGSKYERHRKMKNKKKTLRMLDRKKVKWDG